MKATGTLQQSAKAFLVCLIGTESVRDGITGRPYHPVEPCLHQLERVAQLVVITEYNVRAASSEWSLYQLPACQPVCLKRRTLEHLVGELAYGYDRRRVLVIGSGPRALSAAQSNQLLFYPILPRKEERSWARLQEEGIPKFLHGTFQGYYQQALLAAHQSCLPPGYPSKVNPG